MKRRVEEWLKKTRGAGDVRLCGATASVRRESTVLFVVMERASLWTTRTEELRALWHVIAESWGLFLVVIDPGEVVQVEEVGSKWRLLFGTERQERLTRREVEEAWRSALRAHPLPLRRVRVANKRDGRRGQREWEVLCGGGGRTGSVFRVGTVANDIMRKLGERRSRNT